jgi:flagellar biosynthesis/type III secretory pathway protein FliH
LCLWSTARLSGIFSGGRVYRSKKNSSWKYSGREEEKNMAYVTTAERIGIKKGFSQGKEQGIELGREKGREQQKHEDARAMEAEGIARPVIARVLKVTEEELAVILGEGEK